jgi:hypothetical protein
LADQTGIGTPSARFIAQPTTVRITTPTISIAISSGVCKSPRLTIKVVAPVGGCEERRRSSTAPVSATESAAAPVRASVTPSARMLGWSSKPKTA